MAKWKGWAYSVDSDNFSKVSEAEDLGLIEAGIHQILNTVPGERRMLPEFGSRVRYLVFDPHDDLLYAEIGQEVIEAVSDWEPRVILVDVQIRPVEGQDHAVNAQIIWALKSNQRITQTLNVRIEG